MMPPLLIMVIAMHLQQSHLRGPRSYRVGSAFNSVPIRLPLQLKDSSLPLRLPTGDAVTGSRVACPYNGRKITTLMRLIELE